MKSIQQIEPIEHRRVARAPAGKFFKQFHKKPKRHKPVTKDGNRSGNKNTEGKL